MAILIENMVLPHSQLRIPRWSAPRQGLYGIVGPNGSGKSQFFSVLMRTLKPRLGKVSIENCRIGCVMQHPEHQLTEATVRDEMLWPFSRKQQVDHRFQNQLADVIQRWDLEVHWQQSPWTLSTGQKRRLILAVYDLLNPDVLLLDEPSEGLDGEWKKRLATWLTTRAGTRLTLITSHDWPWLLSFVGTGFWCEKTLDASPKDLGQLWYSHQLPTVNPLEQLWRELLNRNAPVSWRGWIDAEVALGQVVTLWKSVQNQ